MDIQKFDLQGKLTKEMVSMPDVLCSVEYNPDLVAQVYHVYRSNQRLSSASPKTRAQVRGGGRKPWSQKGTGRARAGSIRSPLFRGGGVVFGPAGRNWKRKVNKKMRKLAVLSVLRKRIEDQAIKAVEFGEKTPAKDLRKFVTVVLNDPQIDAGSVVVITEDDAIRKAIANVDGVTVTAAVGVNIENMLSPKLVIVDTNSIDKLVERFSDEK